MQALIGARVVMVDDIRFAIRQLVSQPGFAAVAVLTLALGIGACAAIFSVVNGVLLRPLNYPDPDRLVVIRETNFPRFPEFSVSGPNFLDWQKETKSYSALAAYVPTQADLTGEAEPHRLVGVKATAEYFKVYGTPAMLGRTFSPEDDSLRGDHVVVLSYSFWQRAFGGQRDIIGESVRLNSEPYTVIGIMPPEFGGSLDAWLPMAFTPEQQSDNYRRARFLNVVGRLKPEVTSAEANAELSVVAEQLAKQYPNSNKGWGAVVIPMLDYTVRDVRVVLYVLLAAVGSLLLVACANIANLLLARATSRHRELSIRAALGASRVRLIKQLLTESVLLALFGGGAGLLVAQIGLRALLTLAPANLPRTDSIHVDYVVLAFCFCLSLLTGVGFGLAPAWAGAHTNISDSLKQGARGATDPRGNLRNGLVILEITLALLLLGVAGLLTRSFIQLTHVDLGFQPANATVLTIGLVAKKYERPEQQLAFADAVLERLKNLPGVASVGLTHTLPLTGDWVTGFMVEGQPRVAPADMPPTNLYAVTRGYFSAMGIELIRGRLFADQDGPNAEPVAIINETLARQYFAGQDPVGKRIELMQGGTASRQIVGVVRDVKQYGIDKQTTCQTYVPFAQRPAAALNIVVRTNGSSAALISAFRAAVYGVDKDQPVNKIEPLEAIASRSIAKQRFAMVLLNVFSGIALLIAAVGVYGLMTFVVVQRRVEIGIRMALGARHRDVLRLIFVTGVKLVAYGVLAGIAATMLVGRAMGSILFQTGTFDPTTLFTITVVLTAVALLACLFPALRATTVDPIVALREE